MQLQRCPQAPRSGRFKEDRGLLRGLRGCHGVYAVTAGSMAQRAKKGASVNLSSESRQEKSN
jgi:hypothetical protein